MSKNILITYSVTDEQTAAISAAAPGSTLRNILKKDITREDILWADIILGSPPMTYLHENDHLALVSLNSAGSTEYCAPGILPDNTVLTNATGAYGIIISEWMIGMLLNIYNHFAYYRDLQKQNCWQKLSRGRYSVYGAKILIVGAGNIGTEFAKRAKAMGAYTIGIRRSDTTPSEYFDEVHLTDALDTLLPQADVVALSLPGTDETAHILSDERLALMKQGSVLLNVGRGSAVDTDALCKHLQSGHLMAAALDVTDPEPLNADHPLWQEPNAYITPHISGGMDSPISRRIIFELGLHNLKAYLGNGDYRNVVDRNTGYRKL
ncbi:MAG: D-2-hydroxyacid dehydrogenase [Clostridia bacterium]|nr:D-2-hydroxyacid dehydrogenase [Clostridia bacterium]